MAEVIGVRFKNTGKVYYFDPQGQTVEKGAMAIVETARGMECGEVALENREVADESIVQPLRKLIRLATKEDLKKVAENHIKEKKAFKACEKKIAERGLEMKLVDVEYTFDNSKILFYFTADGRVDFRELVKDLAGMFRTRIELRQIGVRDEAKMLGGMGICGRPFCCGTFLGGFTPVSIKMAKEQGRAADVLPEVRAGGLPGPAEKHPQGGGFGVHPRRQGRGHRAEPVDPKAHHPAGQGPGRRPQGVQSGGGKGAAGREDQGGQKGIGRAEKAGGNLKSPQERAFWRNLPAGGKTLAFYAKCVTMSV